MNDDQPTTPTVAYRVTARRPHKGPSTSYLRRLPMPIVVTITVEGGPIRTDPTNTEAELIAQAVDHLLPPAYAAERPRVVPELLRRPAARPRSAAFTRWNDARVVPSARTRQKGTQGRPARLPGWQSGATGFRGGSTGLRPTSTGSSWRRAAADHNGNRR